MKFNRNSEKLCKGSITDVKFSKMWLTKIKPVGVLLGATLNNNSGF